MQAGPKALGSRLKCGVDNVDRDLLRGFWFREGEVHEPFYAGLDPRLLGLPVGSVLHITLPPPEVSSRRCGTSSRVLMTSRDSIRGLVGRR